MLKNLKDKFNKLAQKVSLNSLSDRHLKLVRKASQVSATLAAGHAGLWVAVGVVGAIALGLNAAGVCIPMFLGVGTIALGALFALKSAVANRVSDALYKASTHILEKRGVIVQKAPAPKTDAKPSTTMPPLKPAFGPAAQPESKNDNTPPPATPPAPAKQEPPKP